jgi:hypothetical protein
VQLQLQWKSDKYWGSKVFQNVVDYLPIYMVSCRSVLDLHQHSFENHKSRVQIAMVQALVNGFHHGVSGSTAVQSK